MPNEFGIWQRDPKTGEKVPGVSPRNATKQTAKPKPAKPATAREK